MTNNKCELCCADAPLTKHHLIPQLKCKNKYKTLKNDDSNFLWVCHNCHTAIHAYFSETELRDTYNTKEALLSNEKFNAFVNWRIKHPLVKDSAKMSNDRKQHLKR